MTLDFHRAKELWSQSNLNYLISTTTAAYSVAGTSPNLTLKPEAGQKVENKILKNPIGFFLVNAPLPIPVNLMNLDLSSSTSILLPVFPSIPGLPSYKHIDVDENLLY